MRFTTVKLPLLQYNEMPGAARLFINVRIILSFIPGSSRGCVGRQRHPHRQTNPKPGAST